MGRQELITIPVRVSSWTIHPDESPAASQFPEGATARQIFDRKNHTLRITQKIEDKNHRTRNDLSFLKHFFWDGHDF